MNPLQQWFDSHVTGLGIWKWAHYFEIYHRYFARFQGLPVHVCEIGVYSGGSLQMWREYFGPQAQIYGVDIQPACRRFETDRCKIFVGDQADREFWKRFKAEVPKLDILIDDGGHEAHQQRITFEEMFSHLSPGGVYVCEDIHGAGHGFSQYMAATATMMNSNISNPDTSVVTFTASQLQKECASLHFYPYLVVAERTEEPVDKFTAPGAGSEWIWQDPEWKP